MLSRSAARVLVIAYDVIGERMAGPGARSWELAHAVARFAPVTLASREPISRGSSTVELVLAGSDRELEALANEADAVIYQGFSLEGHPRLESTLALRVVDLYDPWVFENLEHQRPQEPELADYFIRRVVDVQRGLLQAGDFFLCASERQRDYWLGMLTSAGRVEPAVYRHDPTLRTLIDVVPYGCPDDPPRAHSPVLRGVRDGIEEDSFIILWSGGTWEWFDPLLVLDAFEIVLREESRARLVFMGLELAREGIPPQKVAQELRERSAERGLLGREVVLGDWVPYDERGAYLLEAEVAVIAARALAESRLAFRSRALDHFWAGLPTITTGGDVVADLIEREGAGIVVPTGDVGAMAEALLKLVRDHDARKNMAARAVGLADRFRWSKVVAPLRGPIEDPTRWHALRAARTTPASDASAGLTGIRASPTFQTAWRRTPDSLKRVIRPVARRLLR